MGKRWKRERGDGEGGGGNTWRGGEEEGERRREHSGGEKEEMDDGERSTGRRWRRGGGRKHMGRRGAWGEHGEEMEEGRRRGREGDEMENRIREMNRREARGQTRWQSGLPLPLSLPWLLFVLCTPTSLSRCSISQEPVGSALSRQPCKLKSERKGAGQKSLKS